MSAEKSSCRESEHHESSTACSASASYELRFARLFNPGRVYSFPCDANGHVDIDSLHDVARLDYFYARTVIGREFRAPVTCAVLA